MVSSPSGDTNFEEPPRGPGPPAGMISPQGQSAPFNPHFINFLGDTNVPSTGLTPEMLAAIDASNGPTSGPPQTGMGGGPPMAPPVDKRAQLAKAMMQQQEQLGLGRNGSAGGWR